MARRRYILLLTLNVNVLNTPTKRLRLAKWAQKQELYMLSTRDPMKTQGHMQTEVNGRKRYSLQMEIKSKLE